MIVIKFATLEIRAAEKYSMPEFRLLPGAIYQISHTVTGGQSVSDVHTLNIPGKDLRRNLVSRSSCAARLNANKSSRSSYRDSLWPPRAGPLRSLFPSFQNFRWKASWSCRDGLLMEKIADSMRRASPDFTVSDRQHGWFITHDILSTSVWW